MNVPPGPEPESSIFTGYAYALKPDCVLLEPDGVLSFTIPENDWTILRNTPLSLWLWDASAGT
jgi:hypothetical protein